LENNHFTSLIALLKYKDNQINNLGFSIYFNLDDYSFHKYSTIMFGGYEINTINDINNVTIVKTRSKTSWEVQV